MPNWLPGVCWRTSEASNDDIIAAEDGEKLMVITEEPKNSATFLCCSAGESQIREDQVDLCPQSWFREFTEDPEGQPWTTRVRRVLWRLCFVGTCLPLCYPCYLCRTVRRRRKQAMFPMLSEDILKKFSEEHNKTLQRQITKKSGINSDSLQKLLYSNVINANVILLHSPASSLLHPYLRSSDGCNEAEADPEEPVRSSLSRKSAVRSSNSYFAPNLTTVTEEDSKLLGGSTTATAETSVNITIDECDSNEPFLLRRKTIGGNVRRKSSLAVRLSSHLGRIRRNSLKRQTSQEDKKQEEEEEVTLRLSVKPKPHLGQRRPSRKLSVVSGSSIYYSFDSDDDDEDPRKPADPSRSFEMETLGKRTELVKDLDCQVAFNLFDEATLADWQGHDLREAHRVPNFDILVVAVRKGNVQEIGQVLNLQCGIMGYIAKFWVGFFPLLIIEVLVQEDPNEENDDYGKKLNQLRGLYGDVLHVTVSEEELSYDLDWLHECMARLFLHARIYQCSRFFGADVIKTMPLRCPGGCGLKKAKGLPKKFTRQKVALKKRRSKAASSSVA